MVYKKLKTNEIQTSPDPTCSIYQHISPNNSSVSKMSTVSDQSITSINTIYILSNQVHNGPLLYIPYLMAYWKKNKQTKNRINI